MLIFSIIAIIIAFVNVWFEFLRDLMMLQQNSYRNERYARWMRTSQDSTSVMRLVSGAVVLASLSTLSVPVVGLSLVSLISIVNIWNLATRKYKKPLVMTQRARRIFCVMIALALILVGAMVAACLLTGSSLVAAAAGTLAVYCFSLVFPSAANWLLKPVEKRINQGFYDDAKRILSAMPDLKIVGITGSYGKTSTKHYLHRILSEQFDTMMTPGSFNTTLGVIRTIREHLKPYNEVFIVEMGAKQAGDIKEICDLVNPSMGIITAVGEQHLESFGSIENVQKTKFELVDALPSDGLAVLNDDFEYVANRKVDNVKALRYNVNSDAPADFHASDITYSPSGTTFSLKGPDGFEAKFTTRLVGECNVSNLIAAIAVALRLGMSVDKISRAVAQIEQVEHRLNMKRTPGGVTIIDDAFNSNPTGSKMALDVLAMMRPGKRIVVTPGMIELGARQRELNYEFGRKIATSADVAVIVGEYNREAITEGIKSVEPRSASIHEVATFNDARLLVDSMIAPGDTILYENDLPDTFK